jgi:hypothetical protein
MTTMQKLGRVLLLLLAGCFSCVVSLHALWSAISIDYRFFPVLSFLYCALPLLSFPVFLLALAFRKLVVLQAIFAVAWLPVFAALNWRTCAETGYCGSIAATVIRSLMFRFTLAFFAAAICSVAAAALRRRPGDPNH